MGTGWEAGAAAAAAAAAGGGGAGAGGCGAGTGGGEDTSSDWRHDITEDSSVLVSL